jgi:N-acetylneuraminic acid mutarotase
MTPLRQTVKHFLLIASIVFAATTLLPQPCHAGAGFENTGNLVYGRINHTATLLPNGKVLAVGGDGSYPGAFSPALPFAELYAPATRTWTATGSLAHARNGHTATLLPNGKVLVVGGYDWTFELDSVELYDPATGTWTPTGSLNVRRRLHTATLLSNGKVLVAGGGQGEGAGYISLTSAELFDPTTGTWSVTGSLAAARAAHTATLLSNGKVLVAGGFPSVSGAGIPPMESAELYDPGTGTWSSTGSLNSARSSHTATLLANGEVLAVGGAARGSSLPQLSAELYNPGTGTWRTTGNLSTRRAFHSATLLPDNRVLVAGGVAGNTFEDIVASAELYDSATGTWTPTGSLITRRRLHTATLLQDGTVLAAGGSIGNDPDDTTPHLDRAELYVNAVPSLLNISTRMNVQTGDNVLIGGFIITGTQQKTVIVRGMGPSLPVPGALANPVIEVHGPSGQLLGTNDDWKDASTKQQISESGLAPANDLESAFWGILNPGAYTVILSGKNGGTGIGSVEVYDLNQAADSRLANISARGFVNTGDNIMIAGLIVSGGSPFGSANVIVRALGPSIPMSGALANPTLELYDANGNVIAFNDDWKTRPDGTSQQAEIELTSIPPTKDPESAVVQRLPAGNYTAVVRGKNNTTGIGLVEVYHLQ